MKEFFEKNKTFIAIILAAFIICGFIYLSNRPKNFLPSFEIQSDRDLFEILLQYQNNLAQLNVGYLTISITIIIALGGIYYLFNLRPFEKRLEDHEKKMENYKQELENQKTETLNYFKKLKNELTSLTAETGRSLALHADQRGIYDAAFYWWIFTAYYSYKCNVKNLFQIGLNAARRSLNKVTTQIDFLTENLSSIYKMLDKLREEAPKEIENIRKLLEEKLKIEKGKLSE